MRIEIDWPDEVVYQEDLDGVALRVEKTQGEARTRYRWRIPGRHGYRYRRRSAIRAGRKAAIKVVKQRGTGT